MTTAIASHAHWLNAVDGIVDQLERGAPAAELAGEPTAEVVKALCDAGLMDLKAPRDVGGAEANWPLQIAVFEKVAYHNLAAAWCLMLYVDNTGKAAAFLPDEGLARLCNGAPLPAVCGGGGLMMGELTPVEGGYRLSGRWIYGSGIHQAQFVQMTARVVGGGPEVIQCVVPRAQLQLVDNWQVMGLKGTGSCDFVADDLFVPAEMTYVAGSAPRRGGALFRLGTFGYAGLCMPAVMVGAARRALDDLGAMAAAKSRGYTVKTTLAERGAFQAFVGAADLKLKAARALTVDMGKRLLADAERLGNSPERNEAEARAVGTYCSDVTVEVMNRIVAYAGGEGIRAGHRFERTLRDLQTAATHMFVSDIAYETHARFVMDLPDVKMVA